ncbi:MAG: helix-turn-helix transcriptional regulator [Planctomycetaceae bacterium]|nr:helix-turn-helix transcriptional regulator [Planctomycetaceae bacterium]
MNNNRTNLEWLRAAAQNEAECQSVSVGGLAVRLGVYQPEESGGPAVFGQLVELGRRRLRLTVEQLAEAADVDIEELVLIERGECKTPSPRTVHKLAERFNLPTGTVAQIAGLVKHRNERLGHAAYLFAARSEPTAALTPDEEMAYEEFVKVIIESSEVE